MQQIPPGMQLPQDQFTGQVPPTLASAAKIYPSSVVSFISGTVQIATIVPPIPGTHQLVFIFTNAAPGQFLTSGNIGLGVTPTQNASVVLFYDSGTKKYYPTVSAGGTGGGTPSTPANSVQFNDAGSFGGDADFTWDKTTNLINFTSDAGLSFAGAKNPITMVGGDDGFGDSAIVIDNPTDGYIVMKYNQFVDIEAVDGWEVFNTNGSILFGSDGSITLHGGNLTLHGPVIEEIQMAVTRPFALILEEGTPGHGTVHVFKLGGDTDADIIQSFIDGQPSSDNSDERVVAFSARPATALAVTSDVGMVLSGQWWNGSINTTQSIEFDTSIDAATGKVHLIIQEITGGVGFPFLDIVRQNTSDAIISAKQEAAAVLNLSAWDTDDSVFRNFISLTSNATPTLTIAPPTGGTTSIQATTYKSSDGSTGATTTITSATLAGKTITVKNGLITSFA